MQPAPCTAASRRLDDGHRQKAPVVRYALRHYVRHDREQAIQEVSFLERQGQGPKSVSARQRALHGAPIAAAMAVAEKEAVKAAAEKGGTTKRYKSGAKRRPSPQSTTKQRKRRDAKSVLTKKALLGSD
jgi:hypothetical protein